MTRVSQDWVGENVTVKTRSLTSEERWKGSELINGRAPHPIRVAFWGEGNDPVTFVIRVVGSFHFSYNLKLYIDVF